MKNFTVNCNFEGGQTSPVTLYVGKPDPEHHPLHFQNDWLSRMRGGTIPQDVMDEVSRLYELSKKRQVSFEDLCVYTLGIAS